MAKRSITDALSLANGVNIPQLGFGVFESPRDVCVKSCLTALQGGYRHIDTAQYYANETEVGSAVQQSGLPRKDIFLTTKFLAQPGSVDKSYQSCVNSVKKLDPQHGYVDLFLIHSPHSSKSKRAEMWQALERLHEEGKAKSIGVSNFGIKHIEELKDVAKVWPPHVNQIEVRNLNLKDYSMLMLFFPEAASLVSAEADCRILPKERHHHRSILPSGP